MSAKNWIFTYNEQHGSTLEGDNINGTVQCISDLMDVYGISFIVFQLERGAAGTSHLQGYCQFSTRKSFNQVRTALSTAMAGVHIEKAKGSPDQCKAYCTKEETRVSGPYEFGEMSKPGRRNDIQEFVDAMPLNDDEIYDRFPHIVAKYPRFVRELQRRRRRQKLSGFVPRAGWQTELASLLNSPADPRKVHWYFDPTGCTGKSYFGLHFGNGVGYVVTGGKHADIFYAYNYEPIVFFDWPRSHEEAFPYGVVESFKNGYFLSTKYESQPVRFATPHVIVFANFEPDRTKLSEDRWQINQI